MHEGSAGLGGVLELPAHAKSEVGRTFYTQKQNKHPRAFLVVNKHPRAFLVVNKHPRAFLVRNKHPMGVSGAQ